MDFNTEGFVVRTHVLVTFSPSQTTGLPHGVAIYALFLAQDHRIINVSTTQSILRHFIYLEILNS